MPCERKTAERSEVSLQLACLAVKFQSMPGEPRLYRILTQMEACQIWDLEVVSSNLTYPTSGDAAMFINHKGDGNMASKKDFLIAYSWMYGTTKAEASDMYRRMNSEDPRYIEDVVNCFRENCRKGFYTD